MPLFGFVLRTVRIEYPDKWERLYLCVRGLRGTDGLDDRMELIDGVRDRQQRPCVRLVELLCQPSRRDARMAVGIRMGF